MTTGRARRPKPNHRSCARSTTDALRRRPSTRTMEITQHTSRLRVSELVTNDVTLRLGCSNARGLRRPGELTPSDSELMESTSFPNAHHATRAPPRTHETREVIRVIRLSSRPEGRRVTTCGTIAAVTPFATSASQMANPESGAGDPDSRPHPAYAPPNTPTWIANPAMSKPHPTKICGRATATTTPTTTTANGHNCHSGPLAQS